MSGEESEMTITSPGDQERGDLLPDPRGVVHRYFVAAAKTMNSSTDV